MAACPPPEQAPAAENHPKDKSFTPDSSKMKSQNEKAASPFLLKNAISGFLSIVSFVLSLALLAYGIYLLYMRTYDCQGILGLPRVQTWTGVGLIVMFLLSNAALVLRQRTPIPALVAVLVPLIFMLFTGLAFVGVNQMASKSLPATPLWFKLKVRDDATWNDVKSCIYDKGVCYELVLRSFKQKSYDFSTHKLSSIESGCCIPPAICGMVKVNATYWRRKGGGNVAVRETEEAELPEVEKRYRDRDCDLWSNDRSVLCYDCQSCRDGFVKSLRRSWWKRGVFFVVMSILLMTSHLLLFLATMYEHYFFKG